MRTPVGVLLGVLLAGGPMPALALTAAELAVVYRRGDPDSERSARAYQHARRVPDANVVGLDVPLVAVLPAEAVASLRDQVLRTVPDAVQALLLVWDRPYAAGCMSITSAFATGYRPEACEPGCGRTAMSPVFDAETLEHARRLGWRIAMMLPADHSTLALDLIERGVRSDGRRPPGTVYLVETMDRARNVRAPDYGAVVAAYRGRVDIRTIGVPEGAGPQDVIAYFTGTAHVVELGRLGFRPGAVADHLTSIAGVLDQSLQTTAVDWLRAGATGSYGTVTEPCNHVGKFPSPLVFVSHYLRGETLIEAYWKSVAMPGQGLFVGEPLAAPFASPVH